jgi:uracil phosphoribosyltransferase
MPPVALTLVEHPLVDHVLAALRDQDTPPAAFRTLARRVTLALVLEASRQLPASEVEVRTPLSATRGRVLLEDLAAVAILRAGLGMLEAVVELFPDVAVGCVGLERDEVSLQPHRYYEKLPPLGGRHVLVLDPMLATGGSGSAACAAIKAGRPRDVRFVCVVAAPEGVRRMEEEHPDVGIVAAALDERLDDRGFIVPGLGDFGDRLFGTSSGRGLAGHRAAVPE